MDISDGDLVRLARDGDPTALRLLVERHLPMARARAARLCPPPDDADDAVQDAFLQAFIALDRLRDPNRFAGWLGGIVANVCRAQRRRAPLTLLGDWRENLHPAAAGSLPPAEDLDRVDALGRAVAGLPPGQRHAVTLFYYADQPAGQVPGTPGAAKASLHKARRQLREYITAHRPDLIPAVSRRFVAVWALAGPRVQAGVIWRRMRGRTAAAFASGTHARGGHQVWHWSRADRRMVVDEELSAELLEHAGRDQAARMSLRPGHGMREWETVVAPVDRDNTARLREIVGRHSWPGHRLVGEAGAHAAWLLAQHAPPDLQEECLPLLQDAVVRGDASPAGLAYLMDRVLMHRGEPQIYGTQYQVRDGVLELWIVRDPSGLDQRRAALGLEPEAANRARLLAAEGLTGEHHDDEPARGG